MRNCGRHRLNVVGALLAAALVSLVAIAPGGTAAAGAAQPIEGTWGFGNDGAVTIKATGATTFTGTISKAAKIGACTHPVGQVMWQLSGSGTHYTGTHLGYNEPACTEQPGMNASWDVTQTATTSRLTFCAEVEPGNTQCLTLRQVTPVVPTPSTSGGTRAPVIEAHAASGVPGAKIRLHFVMSDDSGRAKSSVVVYLDSAVIAGPFVSPLGPAVAGEERTVVWTAPTARPAEGGSLRFCVQAEDAAGNKSPIDCAPITVVYEFAAPPLVKAYVPDQATPGSVAVMQYTARGDGGSAAVELTLYQGGTPVAATRRTLAPAERTARQTWVLKLDRDLVGPLYFCVSAVNAAGNRSANNNPGNHAFDAPLGRSCVWVSLLVPLTRVSSTCGGSAWSSLAGTTNLFRKSYTYQSSLSSSYDVSFADACALRAAAYAGLTVRDPINGGVVDFRTWSRPRIDRKFLADLRQQCAVQIPPSQKSALHLCTSRGAAPAYGALALSDAVDAIGWRFFDADLVQPGIQRFGPRAQFD